MRAWIRGGLWGAGIGLFLWIFPLILNLILDISNIEIHSWEPTYNILLATWFIAAPFCAMNYNFNNPEMSGFCWLYTGHITYLILGFIIGALVGLAITKIKSQGRVK